MKILKVPSYEQTSEYDCGAKAVQSLLAYYGMDVKEERIIKVLGTHKLGKKVKYAYQGTPAKKMIAYLRRKGLKCIPKEGMTIKELKENIDKGRPILLILQAWPEKKVLSWKKTWNTGHYVIAIGYDHEKIIFEDPYIYQRSYLHFDELEQRWHDDVQDLGKVRNYGVIIYGKSHYKNLGKIVHMD